MAEKADVTEATEAPQAEQTTEQAAPAAEAAGQTGAQEVQAPETEPSPEGEVAEAMEPIEATPTQLGSAEEEEATEAPPAAEPAVVFAEPSEAEEELPPPSRDIYYYGTGRRKTASAQVRMYPSKEPEIVVNDKAVEEYFSRSTDLVHLKEPLHATATEDMFRISIKVQGGGITGQAGAIRHGIARALVKANPELRPTLRKHGFLTRDPRAKERKKPGLKRARKAPQYTKR